MVHGRIPRRQPNPRARDVAQATTGQIPRLRAPARPALGQLLELQYEPRLVRRSHPSDDLVIHAAGDLSRAQNDDSDHRRPQFTPNGSLSVGKSTGLCPLGMGASNWRMARGQFQTNDALTSGPIRRPTPNARAGPSWSARFPVRPIARTQPDQDQPETASRPDPRARAKLQQGQLRPKV